MISIVPALRARLLAISALTAVVGARVFRDLIPLGVDVPAVVIASQERSGEYHTTGHDGIARAELMVTLWCATAAGADELAELVDAAPPAGLRGDRGPWGELDVQGCFIAARRDVEAIDVENHKRTVYGVEFTLRIVYRG